MSRHRAWHIHTKHQPFYLTCNSAYWWSVWEVGAQKRRQRPVIALKELNRRGELMQRKITGSKQAENLAGQWHIPLLLIMTYLEMHNKFKFLDFVQFWRNCFLLTVQCMCPAVEQCFDEGVPVLLVSRVFTRKHRRTMSTVIHANIPDKCRGT